jgi:hypothetical protein
MRKYYYIQRGSMQHWKHYKDTIVVENDTLTPCAISGERSGGSQSAPVKRVRKSFFWRCTLLKIFVEDIIVSRQVNLVVAVAKLPIAKAKDDYCEGVKDETGHEDTVGS